MALNHITYVTFHCALTWEILKLLSIFQGTGVGDTRNPSDLVSQGLDPKNSSDSLRLRFHVRNGLPRAISATQKDHGWDAIVWKVQLWIYTKRHTYLKNLTIGNESFTSLNFQICLFIRHFVFIRQHVEFLSSKGKKVARFFPWISSFHINDSVY